MPPGRYSVEATHTSFARVLRDDSAFPEGSFDQQLVRVMAGERRRLDFIERSRGSILKIAVLDDDGKPSRGFALLPPGAHSISSQPLSFVDVRRLLGRLVPPGWTSQGGPVEHAGLTPGPYTVVVLPDASGSSATVVTRVVEITGDARAQSVEIRLPPQLSAAAAGR